VRFGGWIVCMYEIALCLFHCKDPSTILILCEFS